MSEDSSVQDLLLKTGAELLGELGWQGDASAGSLIAEYTGDSGTWYVAIEVFPDQELLLVYSIGAEPVPPDRVALVGEYVNRVNDGLPRANLEIDHDTGVVKCRSSLDVEEVDAVGLAAAGYLKDLLRRVLQANLATFDLARPGLAKVITGVLTPAEADAEFGEE